MATLEQVERLREKAHVSYEDAKEALEATGGDLLEAMIYLEKHGRVASPQGEGYSRSDEAKSGDYQEGAGSDGKEEYTAGESFGEMVKRFIVFCGKIIHKGNVNSFEIYKGSERKASFPITLLVILILFAFWLSVPLLIIGLFFGLRYRFSGPNIRKGSVNSVMDTAADTADDIKKSFKNNNP